MASEINMIELEDMLAEFDIDIKDVDGLYKDTCSLLSELCSKIFDKVES